MSRLPPGCNLNNKPGQHDPPEWCYIARIPGQYRYGWDYESLSEWAAGESSVSLWSWSL